MRISIVISTLLSGGAERNACVLANYFTKNNDVKLITFQKSKKSFYDISKKVEIKNLNLLKESSFFFIKILNFLKRIYIIRKNFKKEKPEVIISFLETTNITVLISSLFLKDIKLKIISDRNNPNFTENKILIFFLKKLFYQSANFLILQTNKIKENYKFINNKKIKIIPNTISKIQNVKKKILINNSIKILCVGRLENQKGYNILIRALKYLKNDKIKFKCDIYGTGSEKSQILNEIKDNKLSKNIELKGVNKNLINIYHKYDFYILTSKFEGYPNSLLEGLSAGLICISSNCDYGPNEIITNNKNGLLFQNNNYLDLYEKINYLIKNKKKLNTLSQNAKKEFNYLNFNEDKFLKWKKIVKIK